MSRFQMTETPFECVKQLVEREKGDEVNDEAAFGAYLAKYKGTKAWCERYCSGLDNRAILSAFILAFTMGNIMELNREDWQDTTLFKLNAAALVLSSACNLFAVIIFTIVSSMVARMLGRDDSRVCVDHAETRHEMSLCNHSSNPHDWFVQPGGSQCARKKDVPEIQMEDLKPRAFIWLNAQSNVKFYGNPRAMISVATTAFLTALGLYLLCLTCKLCDALDLVLGVVFGVLMMLGFGISIHFLHSVEGFDIS